MRPSRKVSESEVSTTHWVMPTDANVSGNCFGGSILAWMDGIAGISAWKHCRTRVVTVAVESIHFGKAVHIGNIVSLKAHVDYVGRTSVEVGVEVDTEDTQTGEKKHCLDGHFTFVALDESGKPIEAPAIEPETDLEWKRYRAAEERVKSRKKEKQSD